MRTLGWCLSDGEKNVDDSDAEAGADEDDDDDDDEGDKQDGV